MFDVDDDVMLTTYDNPINPFENFDLWWKTDLLLGHDCCGLLAINSNVNDLASENVNEKKIFDAMKYICSREPMIYRMVTKESYVAS